MGHTVQWVWTACSRGLAYELSSSSKGISWELGPTPSWGLVRCADLLKAGQREGAPEHWAPTRGLHTWVGLQGQGSGYEAGEPSQPTVHTSMRPCGARTVGPLVWVALE